LSPFVTLNGGSKILAQQITVIKLDGAAAKLALQWMGETGQDDRTLRQALQIAAGIQTESSDYSPEFIKQLVAEANEHGDAAAGAAIFTSAQATCVACHQVDKAGGILGPDLSAIGRAMTPEAIVESVLWPKRQVKEGFLLTIINTTTGQTLQGYKVSETAEILTLKDISTQQNQVIRKSDIKNRSDAGTLMPEGLTDWMSAQQRHSLLQYLFQLGK
jgi:putative heme-binding domain-containing protein